MLYAVVGQLVVLVFAAGQLVVLYAVVGQLVVAAGQLDVVG